MHETAEAKPERERKTLTRGDRSYTVDVECRTSANQREDVATGLTCVSAAGGDPQLRGWLFTANRANPITPVSGIPMARSESWRC